MPSKQKKPRKKPTPTKLQQIKKETREELKRAKERLRKAQRDAKSLGIIKKKK